MSPQEFEPLLHDAEVRMARLRALYEQWFQGIERTEPAVPRKEFDRLLDVLKKNLPRNTALRFRYQMLIARYQSYITYWQRISRQIEDGTYKRDVQRARRRGRPSVVPPKEAGFDLEVDVEVEPAQAAPARASQPPAAQAPRLPDFDDTDLDAILGALGARTEAPPAPRKPISPFASAPPSAPSSTRASSPPGAPATRAGVATFGRPKDSPGSSSEMRALTPMPPMTPLPPMGPITPIPPGAMADKPAPAPRPALPPAAGRPPPPPGRPAGPAPSPRALGPLQRPPAPGSSAGQPISGARPMPAHPGASAAIEEARMRAIYDRYVEARRRNNERVDNVKYETLAASVEKMLPKLRAKHGDRSIDFDVVVQDGKVGLKPRVG